MVSSLQGIIKDDYNGAAPFYQKLHGNFTQKEPYNKGRKSIALLLFTVIFCIPRHIRFLLLSAVESWFLVIIFCTLSYFFWLSGPGSGGGQREGDYFGGGKGIIVCGSVPACHFCGL